MRASLLCLLGVAAILPLVLAGCNPAARIVAGMIFGAPNKRHIDGLAFSAEIQALSRRACAKFLQVKVPAATLDVGLIAPGEYHLDFEPKVSGANVWVDRPITLEFTRSSAAPKGIILLLHGFGCCKEQMLPWAIQLANDGYWTAMVDLRGHGASTGEWIGFGALEKYDLKCVLDALQREGLAGLPVGVMGVSYGASVALAFAAEDPRVQTVVALEPFSSAAEAIPELARAAFPQQASKISEGLFKSAFSVGARSAKIDWSATDVQPSVSRLQAPVLFLHGTDDTWLAPEHSRRLYARAQPGSRLMLVPEATHISLPVQMNRIEADVRGWFGMHLMRVSQTQHVAAAD
jgi:pimeloyl-ACP methyl ester carboxylesterase